MHISAVRLLLGTPSQVYHHAFFGIKLDQHVYERAGEPDVSIFFVADRVMARSVGRDIPADIFRVGLPTPPDPACADPIRAAKPGMQARDVKALYGAEKLHVDYTRNGRPALHAIYGTPGSSALTSVTFVDGVLTEIEDLGTLPDAAFQAGRVAIAGAMLACPVPASGRRDAAEHQG